MRNLITSSIVGAALALLGAGSALALPLAQDGARSSAAELSPIVRVHGCHRDVEEGRRGWHYHRGRDCDRYAVPPPRRHYRGPQCYTDCKYVGPIKVCKQRCH